jgi:oligoribonuclease (3'-5' exoribonuclease)
MTGTHAKAFAWIDIETDGLPDGHDFSTVNMLEFGMIITNIDLTPITGYHEVVKITQAGAERIRANEFVRQMHLTSGLLQESIQGGMTLAQVEQEAIETIQEAGLGEDDLFLAGSGVAMFDFPFIKTHMPRLAKYFKYFPFDIGLTRRQVKIFAGRDLYPAVQESYQDGVKAHRAYADVEAHLKEAQNARSFYAATARRMDAEEANGPW